MCFDQRSTWLVSRYHTSHVHFVSTQTHAYRLLLEVPEGVLLGDGGDLAHCVHGQVLGEGLAAKEAEAVHGVPLRQLQQGDGSLQRD